MSIKYKNSDILSVPNVNSLFSLKVNDNQLVQTQGYSLEGVGANLYRYDASSTATIDGGFVQPGIGGSLSFSGTTFNGTAGTGRFIAVDQSATDVTKFGALGDAVTDDLSSVQRALNTAATLNGLEGFGGRCNCPSGQYNLSAKITIPQRVKLIGDGRRTAVLLFGSSTSGPLVDVYSGSTARMYDVTVSGFEIRCVRGASAKIALRVLSAEDCIFEHITIRMDFDSVANDDIGVVFSGQENTIFRNMRVHAPTPIKIYGDPQSEYGTGTTPDNTSFSDMVLICNPRPVSNVSTGIWVLNSGLSNITFNGSGVVAKGDHLLYWSNSSGASGTQGFVMSGWRHEQAEDDAKHSIHIDLSAWSNETIVLTGVRTSDVCGGIYARNARITCVGCNISTNSVAGATALAIDASGSVIDLINTVGGGGSGATAQSYGSSTRANLVLPLGGHLYTHNFDQYQSIEAMPAMDAQLQRPGAIFGTPIYTRRFTIPVGKKQYQSASQLAASLKSGIAFISIANKQNNLFEYGIVGLGDGNVQSTSRGTYLMANSPNFSVTPNAASKVNLWTGDANVSTVYIQNNMSQISVTVTADNTTDTITSAGHGLSNGDLVFIESSSALPTGLTANTDYYIINATTDTFQLSTTSGGSAAAFSTNGTGTLTVMECIEGIIWVFMDAAKPTGNDYRQRDYIN